MPGFLESASCESGGDRECESGCELIHVFLWKMQCSMSFILESGDKEFLFLFFFFLRNLYSRQVDCWGVGQGEKELWVVCNICMSE